MRRPHRIIGSFIASLALLAVACDGGSGQQQELIELDTNDQSESSETDGVEQPDLLADEDSTQEVLPDHSPDQIEPDDDLLLDQEADEDSVEPPLCGGLRCALAELCCDERCVDVSADGQNCGACGASCPGTRCEDASCSSSCLDGFEDCDGSAGNGCETAIGSDPLHCGACKLVCRVNETCNAGQCQRDDSCDSGKADCDADPANGCETTVATDPANCGQCSLACPSDSQCILGACSCGFGQIYCDGVCVRTADDLSNCGRCGNSCGTGEICVFGSCQSEGANCIPPTADCDVNLANGCEVNLSNDVMHCGTCSTVCAPSELCNYGMCSGPLCSLGQGNCDADPNNGCETNLRENALHCGACDHACMSNQECRMGICYNPDCTLGTADCDLDPSNGCETEVGADPNHCGQCGVQCRSNEECRFGVCYNPDCGWAEADCDLDPSNGCEVELRDDPNNCGACGKVCNAGEICQFAFCRPDW